MIRELPTALGRVLALLAGAILVACASWVGIAFANGSRIWSPAPLAMLMSAEWLGDKILNTNDPGPLLVSVVAALLFLLLTAPLVVSRPWVLFPAIVFCIGLVLASGYYFVLSWGYGVRYEGFAYTSALAVINLSLAALSVWAGYRAVRSFSFRSGYAFTLVSCMWCVWFAFPWLGEVP